MRAHLLSLEHLGGFGAGRRAAKDSPDDRTTTGPGASASATEVTAFHRPTASSLGMFERFDAWLWRRQQREIEAYLARATDRCDLEARIRSLGRQSPNPYY